MEKFCLACGVALAHGQAEVLQKAMFRHAKGILLHAKRPCFALQNTAFCNVCRNVLVTNVLYFVLLGVLIVLAVAACG